jgi:hypothetical protein
LAETVAMEFDIGIKLFQAGENGLHIYPATAGIALSSKSLFRTLVHDLRQTLTCSGLSSGSECLSVSIFGRWQSQIHSRA